MKNSINLLPSSIIKKYHRKDSNNKILLLPVLFSIIIFLVFNTFISSKINKVEKKRGSLKNQLSEIQNAYSDKKKTKKELKKIKREVQTVKNEIKKVKEFKNRKSKIMKFFKEITVLIPDKVWLKKLNFINSNFTFVLEGTAMGQNLVKKFISNLMDSPYFTDNYLLGTKSVEKEENYLVNFKIRTVANKEELE